jgi:tRNA/tmRNA/rRNA uracil-C5-methylase (TrmA/RlmC/RlmD family)
MPVCLKYDKDEDIAYAMICSIIKLNKINTLVHKLLQSLESLCSIFSATKEMHVLNFHSPAFIAQQLTLAVGSPYLEETVLDLKFQLSPSMHFWNNIHAAKMVCKGIDDLLAPTKRITVLEIGCGFGLIGLYLSKVL